MVKERRTTVRTPGNTLETVLPVRECPVCHNEGPILTWERRDQKTGETLSVDVQCTTCWRKELHI